MSRFIVATDFSTRSDRALRRGSLLAKATQGALTLVHVVDDDQPRELVELETTEARKLLASQTDALRNIDGVDASHYVAQGDPFQAIAKFAEDYKIDLVVLGPHRRQILKDVFIGTTAERTIRNTAVPVLMANALPAAPYRHILVAVDLSENSADALRCATQLNWGEKPALSLFHAYGAPEHLMRGVMSVSEADVQRYLKEAQDRAEASVAAFLRPLNCRPVRQLVEMIDTEPSLMIRRAAKTIGADMVVIGRSERSSLAKLILGSTSEAVLQSADIDVLVVPRGWAPHPSGAGEPP
ncbi:MAG: universal stress protein [Beijerinckiaceae bacterium]|nr:universal stress protein [Beijerinckiaceae bacterium]